jgi:hypothetical protein
VGSHTQCNALETFSHQQHSAESDAESLGLEWSWLFYVLWSRPNI